jgi:hypothetical protein
MVTWVGVLLWLGHLYSQKLIWGQTDTWGLHNHKNNKCDLMNHYSSLIDTMSLSIINLISPNNKDK